MSKLTQVTTNELLVMVESVKNMMLSRATGGSADDREYKEIRSELVVNSSTKDKLPRFVHTCRSIDEFWGFIKTNVEGYEPRRQYIREAFHPLLTELETRSVGPADSGISAALKRFDSDHVTAAWHKALERKNSDPEGAITAARTLLESVCKHILDELGGSYNDKSDLKTLYSHVARLLNLSPSQHTNDVFRQILGGCHSVVEGLGALRNRLSDAHGKGKSSAKPLPRHAELAVNLAGTMATYLVTTWESNAKPDKD